jgi:hypothetical protein
MGKVYSNFSKKNEPSFGRDTTIARDTATEWDSRGIDDYIQATQDPSKFNFDVDRYSWVAGCTSGYVGPPLTLETLLTGPRYRTFFDYLKFRSDDSYFQLPGIDELGYSPCPTEDTDMLGYFEKLAKLQITEIQTKERLLGGATKTPHHFNELQSPNHVIHIEFWGNSSLTVKIWKKPFQEKEGVKVISNIRKVNDNLRYWIRKALSHWTEYSLLLMNCQDQANAIIVPGGLLDKISPKIGQYLWNLPKNVIKGMLMIGYNYCEKDDVERRQDDRFPRIVL